MTTVTNYYFVNHFFLLRFSFFCIENNCPSLRSTNLSMHNKLSHLRKFWTYTVYKWVRKVDFDFYPSVISIPCRLRYLGVKRRYREGRSNYSGIPQRVLVDLPVLTGKERCKSRVEESTKTVGSLSSAKRDDYKRGWGLQPTEPTDSFNRMIERPVKVL